MTTIYRNYEIAKVGDKFVAQSPDDECLLVSKDYQRLHLAIDDLWTALERGEEPHWFAGNSAIDVDTFGPESAPSDVDPPKLVETQERVISYPVFGLSALLVAAPVSYFMEFWCLPKRVDVILAIGVCAVAVAFGKKYALIAAGVAMLVFNFFDCEPRLVFSFPTASEIGFDLMNFVAAVGIPELLKLRFLRGSLARVRRKRT